MATQKANSEANSGRRIIDATTDSINALADEVRAFVIIPQMGDCHVAL